MLKLLNNQELPGDACHDAVGEANAGTLCRDKAPNVRQVHYQRHLTC